MLHDKKSAPQVKLWVAALVLSGLAAVLATSLYDPLDVIPDRSSVVGSTVRRVEADWVENGLLVDYAPGAKYTYAFWVRNTAPIPLTILDVPLPRLDRYREVVGVEYGVGSPEEFIKVHPLRPFRVPARGTAQLVVAYSLSDCPHIDWDQDNVLTTDPTVPITYAFLGQTRNRELYVPAPPSLPVGGTWCWDDPSAETIWHGG